MVDICPPVFPFGALHRNSAKNCPPSAVLNLPFRPPPSVRILREWQASLKIKHVDLQEQSVTQNPREVATKFGKVIDAFSAKEFDEAETVLADWMTYCDEVALYGPDDPLFPATAIAAKSNSGFATNGFTRQHWKTTEPVCKIVRTAYEAAGVPNYGSTPFATCWRVMPPNIARRLQNLWQRHRT